MDRIGDLSLFLRVLDLGSISAAARSQGLSVAVASQHLKRLERELGVRLLHRTTRRIHATPEGAMLAEQGRTLVEDLEALTGGLRQSGTEIVGTLRVTASATFGRQYLSPMLSEFVARHPRVKLSIDLNDQRVDLVSSGFDLAIRIGALDDSTLVARKLAANRRILCASPQYLRRRGTPARPQDLSHHDCLQLIGSQGRQDTWRLGDGKGGEIAVRVSGRFETNLGELISDAGIAGLGIAQYSVWHVCEELRKGRLVQVLADFPLAETGIYAMMPQRRLVPPRIRAFVDFLAERLADPPWEQHLRTRKKRL